MFQRRRTEEEILTAEEFQRQLEVNARKIIITARGEIHNNKVARLLREVHPTDGVTVQIGQRIRITGVLIQARPLAHPGAVPQMAVDREVAHQQALALTVEHGVEIN